MTPEKLATAFEQILNERHSCRRFLNKPVPTDIITRMLTLAQKTASWCNVQPWHVTVLSGSAIDRFQAGLVEQARLGGHTPDIPFPDTYQGEFALRRRECGMQLYSAVGIEKQDREGSARQMMENFRLFGAPHVALITTDKSLGPYALLDCGLYVGNLLNAAQSLGLATIPQAALASHADFIRKQFDWPENHQFLCGVSFGYENTGAPVNRFRTTCADLSQVVTMIE